MGYVARPRSYNKQRNSRAVIKKPVTVRPKSQPIKGKAPVRPVVRPVNRANRVNRVNKATVAKKVLEEKRNRQIRIRRKTVEQVVNRPRAARPAVVRPKKPRIKPKAKPDSRIVVERAAGVRSGRNKANKLSRVGRADIRHSIRSAKTQKVIKAHVNKLKDLKNTGSGKVLVIIACGPSVLEVPIEQLNNHQYIDTMSINKPDKRVWPSTYWSFCDLSQYNRNKDIWQGYQGIIVNSQSIRVGHPRQVLIKNRSGAGFSKDLTHGYYIGRSTTYASLQVAHWFGYNRIYIFGCDMGAVGGKLHHYGQNPDVSDVNRLRRFNKESESYGWAIKNLTDAERKKFYFCSSYNKFGFTSSFNKMDHKIAIPAILDYANSLMKK